MLTATIDTRGTVFPDQPGRATTLTRVAGLPLLARLVRMAGRQKWAAVRIIVADQAERDAVACCLERYPGPPGLTIDLAVEPAAEPAAETGDTMVLDPRGVYLAPALREAAERGTAPEPAVVVRDRKDRARAVRILEESVKKSVQSDGVISFYLIRPLVIPMTRAILPTPITPNQATLTAMAAGITAAVLAAIGGRSNWMVAGALFFACLVIDHVDGQLARLKLKGSRLGEWLDAITDDVTTFALMAGAGIGMYRDGYDPVWMYICVSGAILGSLVHIKMYYDLARLGGAIDIADYPWFFGIPSQTPSRPQGLIGHGTMIINYLVRRDVFAGALVVGLALYTPVALALILCVRGLTMVPMLAIHETVKLFRGRSARPRSSRQ